MSDQLRRQLGLRTATALVVGEMIAVGIFLTPAGMAKTLGSPLWLLVVWLVMGAMALCGAFCYGELAARFPETGGTYVYLREAYGPLLAFLYGWMSLLVLDPGLTAALAVGMASYIGYSFALTTFGLKIVAIAAIVTLAAINIRGVRLGAGLMRWLTVLKLGLLLFIVVWGFAFQLGDWSNFTPFVAQRVGSAPLASGLAGGMVGAFFAFAGWWEVSKITGELRDPARTLPRALTFGVLTVLLVYIMTSAVFMYLVPLDQVSSGETFAAQIGESLFGRAGAQVFSMIVVVSILGSLLGGMMFAPRVYFAMARDGLFLPAAAEIHPRFKTPARAIMIQAALASLLVILGTFNEIVAYFVFITVVFIALAVLAVMILRRRSAVSTSYRTPGYPLTPLVFLTLVTGLLILLAGNNPWQSLLGALIVGAGAPVYYLLVRYKGNAGAS